MPKRLQTHYMQVVKQVPIHTFALFGGRRFRVPFKAYGVNHSHVRFGDRQKPFAFDFLQTVTLTREHGKPFQTRIKTPLFTFWKAFGPMRPFALPHAVRPAYRPHKTLPERSRRVRSFAWCFATRLRYSALVRGSDTDTAGSQSQARPLKIGHRLSWRISTNRNSPGLRFAFSLLKNFRETFFSLPSIPTLGCCIVVPL